MNIQEQNAVLSREYAEAMRYMDNAEETLARSKKNGRLYMDAKYVRTACGTAYNGVLIALDAWLVMKGVDKPSKKQRKSIEFYMSNLARLDKKMLSNMDEAYKILHLYGYYDGSRSIGMIKDGFGLAYDIIEKIKPDGGE